VEGLIDALVGLVTSSPYASNLEKNAEITLGTVSNITEGVQWLGYTYLFVRMRRNPMFYGQLDLTVPASDYLNSIVQVSK
jgi:hypothetical protein